jgi:hypothetical protein
MCHVFNLKQYVQIIQATKQQEHFPVPSTMQQCIATDRQHYAPMQHFAAV